NGCEHDLVVRVRRDELDLLDRPRRTARDAGNVQAATNLEGAGAVGGSIGVAGLAIRAADGAGELLLVLALDADQAVVGGILRGACRGPEGGQQDGSEHNRSSSRSHDESPVPRL